MYDMNNMIWAVIGGMIGTLSVVGIVLYVLLVIACWKIFTKAGEPGWKSIIPIYNVYVLYKIAWKGQMFWALILAVIVACIGSGLGVAPIIALDIIGWILYVVGAIAAAVIQILAYYKLSKAYGYGGGFTVGLLFLPTIFTLILGFGSSTYHGAQS